MTSNLMIKNDINKHIAAPKNITLAGNPNVGKSTIFNALTGMHQHTGNWTGKTVDWAQGKFKTERYDCIITDTPGTYSLVPHSAEEIAASEYLIFENSDLTVVVCDATCIERNMTLLLQIMEVCCNVMLCINLMDQAHKRGISIDIKKISRKIGIPVVAVAANDKSTLQNLVQAIDENLNKYRGTLDIAYSDEIEQSINNIEHIAENRPWNISPRWIALKLLENEPSVISMLNQHLEDNFINDKELLSAVKTEKQKLYTENFDEKRIRDEIAETIAATAHKVCSGAVMYGKGEYSQTDRKADRILTGRRTAFPVMLLMLMGIFWITIAGANIPSQWLSGVLFSFQDVLTALFQKFGAPEWLHGITVLGMYRVLAWVVSVMLPPMAIFFPLFTLLEDAGYLPRIAYNLDKPFRRCGACGKQALTMCMGFGCNAVGVTGCRIIDSPRERMLAILTNSFVPCNGRFPLLITVITMFFAGTQGGLFGSFAGAAILTAFIVIGVTATFAVTKLLSQTLLKGMASSFVLELPSYRKPQFVPVLVRSVADRTLLVLGRAVSVAAPAGAVIWLLANTSAGGKTLLQIFSQFLDPFAQLIGLDGVILMAFILGFPANEIVIPLIIMAYTAQGTITEFDSLVQLKQLFVQNGWTYTTALCTMVFSLMHWPCSTTLLTIKKETGSLKWTIMAAAIPAAAGLACCGAINFVSYIISCI